MPCGGVSRGDIGTHFPDNDERWKDVDSRELLKEVYRLAQQRGYQIGNLDVTIIAQAPKMLPYIQAMREAIAEDVQTSIDNVNVKATTTEKLGFTGRKEGIACEAVVLLTKK